MNTNSNYFYLVDPDTGEIIDIIDSYSYYNYIWKKGINIAPNIDFDSE